MDNPSCHPEATMSKIEWQVESACTGAVRSVTVDGVKRYGQFADGAFRVSLQSGQAFTSAALSKPRGVCIELGGGSACPSLDKFCAGRGCNIAVFDRSKLTCPTLRYAEV